MAMLASYCRMPTQYETDQKGRRCANVAKHTHHAASCNSFSGRFTAVRTYACSSSIIYPLAWRRAEVFTFAWATLPTAHQLHGWLVMPLHPD